MLHMLCVLSVVCISNRVRLLRVVRILGAAEIQSHAISASSRGFNILAVSIFNITEHIYRSSARTYIDLLRSYAKLHFAQSVPRTTCHPSVCAACGVEPRMKPNYELIYMVL